MVVDSKRPWLKVYDPGVPRHLEYPDQPLFNFLSASARQFPRRVCTVFNHHTLSYQQMETLSDALAAALVDLGLARGARVALILPNCPQFVLAFFAILKAGGVVTALNPAYKSVELAFQLGEAEAEMVIALDTFSPTLEAVRAQTPLTRCIYTSLTDGERLNPLPPLTARQPDSSRLIDLLKHFEGAARPQLQVSADDPAVFQFSGGTTGAPKAAVGLHRNLTANTLQFRAWLGGLEAGQETVLAAIPLFHVYGMVIAMCMAISAAAGLVLIPDGRDIPAILQGISRYRVTLFPGVPNLYRSINQHPASRSAKYSLNSVKACICGSAPLPAKVKADFEALTGAKLMEGYGLSEAPTATHCNPFIGENRSGSIGLPLPDVDCRIVSLEDGQSDVTPGQSGELLVRSPQVMAGYHNQPAESAAALKDGWLHTGDVARMDADGYFYLVDRKKDLIKVGGLQVWPREVEEAIMSHPAVLEAGVAGVQHPQFGETVKAWVVCQPGQSVTTEELIAWVKERLADFKAPRQVALVDSLPHNALGKLLRRDLRAGPLTN